MNPDVSVLLCTYNGSATIRAALDTVLRQKTAIAFELVVVDDGSTDGTGDIVTKVAAADPRIRFISSADNAGLPSACNRGLEQCRGELFMRHDDDDLLSPIALDVLARPILEGNSDWTYCVRKIFNTKDGSITLDPSNRNPDRGGLHGLSACGVMMRKDLVDRVGGYRDLFWEEYDLYLRYMRVTKFPVGSGQSAKPVLLVTQRDPSLQPNRGELMRAWGELRDLHGEAMLVEAGLEGLRPERV